MDLKNEQLSTVDMGTQYKWQNPGEDRKDNKDRITLMNALHRDKINVFNV